MVAEENKMEERPYGPHP